MALSPTTYSRHRSKDEVPMKKCVKASSKGLRVSASELAQMGVCERLVVFEKCYGKRRTLVQQQAIRRGQHAHQQFYLDRHLDASAKGCFAITATRIALVLYGWMRRVVRNILWPIRRCIALWAKTVAHSDGT